MTRLVVADAVLLAVRAVYAAWVARTNHGSPIRNLFFGRRPAGRERWVGAAATGVVVGGLLSGTAGYGLGTRAVNFLVLYAAVAVVVVGGQVVYNRDDGRR